MNSFSPNDVGNRAGKEERGEISGRRGLFDIQPTRGHTRSYGLTDISMESMNGKGISIAIDVRILNLGHRVSTH